MRTKVIIDGLKNTQKFRVIINGVIIGDCQVKDLVGNRFQQREQRIAVWDALMSLARQRRVESAAVGLAGRWQNVDVQVDLI